MDKESLRQWLLNEIRSTENTMEDLIQEYNGDGVEQDGMIKAYKNVLNHLDSTP